MRKLSNLGDTYNGEQRLGKSRFDKI
jgi:hypothetical protein